MALSFSLEDVDKLKEIMAHAVSQGLSDIGLGYDNEDGKNALRADLAFTRRSRLAVESRIKYVRRGLYSAFSLTAAGGALFLLANFKDFIHFIVNLAANAH